MSSIFTANRVAAITTWLAGLASFIVGVAGTLPHAWQNYAAIGAGLLIKLVVAIKFMDGSQKYDALVTGPVASAAIPAYTPPPPGYDPPSALAPEVDPPPPSATTGNATTSVPATGVVSGTALTP